MANILKRGIQFMKGAWLFEIGAGVAAAGIGSIVNALDPKKKLVNVINKENVVDFEDGDTGEEVEGEIVES